ncbi:MULTISPECIES: rhodanese-like domain-containing protein [Fischerella]|uniref:Rhodanese-like domain-containing protein n=1 Tax=Fischerella muscicola CCMEE 5323 TaxID=2019572 RepID=A0A2N6K0P8_FISMU|nr:MULTISPECIES: rhodanese-like domain-containing protein [Fischerella]MBD2430923.1 rhodanese-like domain-containing protein [Fischerella sp. FACHB-380]PLZ87784.1 rhodanese-like domain-containing protein [Fischerella muscicola CCMEE 5323]
MDNKIVENIIPSQPPIESQSDAHVLKSRLEWGEPALTILDVRDRQVHNQGHITGAMPMPLNELVDRATATIAKSRDIYVYGSNDEETAQAAQLLRNAGFEHVSELRGGLPAWKAIGGATEGVVEAQVLPSAGAYNVVDRMKEHTEQAEKEV